MRNSALPITSRAEVQLFEQLYQEHLNRIYRFVYSHVRNREAAEDLTSQIFLKALRSLDLKQSTHSVSAWLFRVAHTTVADYWRAYYRRATTHSLETLVETGWEGPIDADLSLVSTKATERVEDILQALPEPRSGGADLPFPAPSFRPTDGSQYGCDGDQRQSDAVSCPQTRCNTR